MTSKEVRELREAIHYLRAEGNDYERGMLILYKLAGMKSIIEKIKRINQTKGIPISQLFTKTNG